MIRNLLILFGIWIAFSNSDLLSGEEVLSWEKCVTLARAHHPKLQVAREKIKKIEADVGITRGALLPEINGTVNGTRSKSVYGSSKSDTYSYGIDGRQLLFDGMKSHHDLKKVKKMLRATVYEYQVVSSNVRLELRSAFVQLMRSQDALVIELEIAKRRKQNLQLVYMRYVAGREHKGSLLTERASLAQAEFDVLQARRGIQLARQRLIYTIGLGGFSAVRVTSTITPPVLAAGQPNFEKLAARSPLLKNMIELMKSAEHGKKSERARFFPRVYAFFNAGKRDISWVPKKTEWSVGVEATVPIFEGGKRFYSVDKADAEARRQAFDTRDIRNDVIFTLQLKWNRLVNAVDRVKVRKRFLDAAEARAKIAGAQYSIGVISFDNWIIIENTLVRTRKDYLDARADALVADAEWKQARGETLENE